MLWGDRSKSLRVLMNSGANESFMDTLVSELGISTQLLSVPMNARGLDGRSIGRVTRRFIHPSSSPTGAWFFFVEKKDKTLPPCINSRGLNDITEHVLHVRQVLQRLLENRLFVKVGNFYCSIISFLEYIIAAGNIQMDLDKVKAVVEWPQPTSRVQLQRFLVFAHFYRCFIFDASDVGVGAVLPQRFAQDQKLHPCALLSHRLNPAERNYDVESGISPFYTLIGSSASLSSGFHPKSSGQSERANQDRETTLWSRPTPPPRLVTANPTTWSQQLVWVEYARNTLPCSDTVLSPFECSVGYQPPLFPEQEEEVNIPSAKMLVRRCRRTVPLFLRPPPGIVDKRTATGPGSLLLYRAEDQADNIASGKQRGDNIERTSSSKDEISRLVTAGRPTTCPLDPIPSSLLQTISGDLLPYLTSLINSSLTAGYVPSVFKRARVAPLLKKPTLDPSDVNNYRPVSLLSFLSKTLERAVLGQLSRYLSQNDLLDPNQSGFKTSHSTETALLCITEALRTAKANSLSSALILLDLSAAFDTVNHQILLSTLSELGISGAAHAWIASYLTGRSYQVAWRESVSSPRALTTGVPQGSVLGPLLFSLYTKSLGSVITSHGLSYHCYADDTQLIFSFPPSDDQVANRISACLADISVWMTDHHLKLNLGKTELLFLPGKDCPFHDLAITVDNSIVSSSQSAKNLGVILDNTLSFSTNIKAVARSCRFMLYNIRRVRPCLTQEAAQVLIQALVISRLDYCNSLLAGLPACAIKPLQLIQNAAARLVFNLPKFSHVTPLLRSLHWLPVEARIRYKTMVLAYGASPRVTIQGQMSDTKLEAQIGKLTSSP
ncbi:uncharacterized protein ACWYII_025626 [Salvelinus alpinus]